MESGWASSLPRQVSLPVIGRLIHLVMSSLLDRFFQISPTECSCEDRYCLAHLFESVRDTSQGLVTVEAICKAHEAVPSYREFSIVVDLLDADFAQFLEQKARLKSGLSPERVRKLLALNGSVDDVRDAFSQL